MQSPEPLTYEAHEGRLDVCMIDGPYDGEVVTVEYTLRQDGEVIIDLILSKLGQIVNEYSERFCDFVVDEILTENENR